eukprot:8855179-Prorocentrum_lima.AAC.1
MHCIARAMVAPPKTPSEMRYFKRTQSGSVQGRAGVLADQGVYVRLPGCARLPTACLDAAKQE